MARETLKDYLGGTADHINYKVNVTGGEPGVVGGVAVGDEGLGKEPNTGIEIIGYGEDKSISSGYLHHITKNKNFYEFSEKPGDKAAHSGDRGNYLPQPEDFIKDDPYVIPGEVQEDVFNSYSNSKYFDNPDTPFDDLGTIIDKVGGTVLGPGDQARGSNELLKDVFIPASPDDESDFVVKASVEALKRNNRFNVDNNYLENNTFPARSDIDSNINITIPGYGGEEDLDNDGRGDKRIVAKTSLDNLKNIGSSLLLRASGYDINVTPGKDLEIVESTMSNIASGDLEESLYTQKKVMSRLLAMNATGFPADKDTGVSARAGTGVDLDYSDLESNSSRSFGSTYNSAVRFTDYSRAQRFKTAFRLAAMVSAAKIAFEEITSEISVKEFEKIKENIKKIAKKTDKVQAGKLILGQSRNSTRFVAKNYFLNNILTVTDFNYEECFTEGLVSMFGKDTFKADSTAGIAEALNSNASNKGKFVKRLDFSDSPGFWHAVSNSIMNSIDGFANSLENLGLPDAGDTESEKLAVSKIFDSNNKILKVVNIIAIIGEKSLHSKNAVKNAKLKNIELTRDPDALPNLPGHRVGKSRIGKQPKSSDSMNPSIGSETTLAWEQSSVPSMYLLPMNIIRAAQTLNNSFSGENPMAGMLGSRMVRNTYTGLDVDGTAARIPNRVVKIVEDRLDAEYVPFYFHDLRTNEIVSFHAFLSQLTDAINPQYAQTNGFGRLDPIQTYQGTTRSLNVGFTVYATNREDFDEMWYKINKLVTLLYPQWTKGSLVQRTGDTRDSTFYQPFSQVIGASPIVRLRVGDVIKSNYSRFGLARTFGIGDSEVKARVDDDGIFSLQSNSNFGDKVADFVTAVREVALTILVGVLGSPQGLIQVGLNALEPLIDNTMAKIGVAAAGDAAASALAEILVNGFANPLMTTEIIKGLKDPNVSGEENSAAAHSTGILSAYKYLNPNFIDGYFCEDDGKTYYTTKRLVVDVEKAIKDDKGNFAYRVKVKDGTAGDGLLESVLLVKHEDLINSPARTFSTSIAGLAFAGGSLDAAGALSLAARAMAGEGKAPDALNGTVNAVTSLVRLLVENPESTFMRPEVNPFTRAFHTTRGRGLAGVIKGVSFDWLGDNIPWETDFNARAPIGCNISFQFDVIHDLPPGLDHTGYNRAPLYNVGEIMKSVAGDPYDETVSESELNFRKAGNRGVYKGGMQFKTQGTEKGGK